MRDSTELRPVELHPVGGWATFARSAELTDALWSLASDGPWHYLNLTAGSSIWESRRDASTVAVHYDGEDRVIQLSVGAGHAWQLVAPLVTRFGLVAAPGDAAYSPGCSASRG